MIPWRKAQQPTPIFLPGEFHELEKPVCRSGSNSYNWTWNNRLVPNRKRSTSRLYIVTLLISLICRVHHEKLWVGRSTSWNQDCQEKYQNLIYADDTTLMAESEEELESLLMKVKVKSEKVGLKLNIQKMKIVASGTIT